MSYHTAFPNWDSSDIAAKYLYCMVNFQEKPIFRVCCLYRYFVHDVSPLPPIWSPSKPLCQSKIFISVFSRSSQLTKISAANSKVTDKKAFGQRNMLPNFTQWTNFWPMQQKNLGKESATLFRVYSLVCFWFEEEMPPNITWFSSFCFCISIEIPNHISSYRIKKKQRTLFFIASRKCKIL